jgi:hypothetical protein
VGIVAHSTGLGAQPFLDVVEQVVEHPTLDVALLGLEEVAVSVEPLSLVTTHAERYVETTGALSVFGPRNAGVSKSRGVALEKIIEVSTSTLTGRVLTETGPCLGDSGSPIIVADSLGAPAVLGILQEGSPSCKRADSYVRSDVISDWVTETIARPPLDDARWGGTSPMLRCFLGAVNSCDGRGDGFGRCAGARGFFCKEGELASSGQGSCEGGKLDRANAVAHCFVAMAEEL